jgi:hypothetical protein
MLKYHRDVPINHPKRELFMQIYQERENLWDKLLGDSDKRPRNEWTNQEIEAVLKSIREYIFIDYFDAKQELSAKELRKMIPPLCQISLALLREEPDAEYITDKLRLALQQITQNYTD